MWDYTIVWVAGVGNRVSARKSLKLDKSYTNQCLHPQGHEVGAQVLVRKYCQPWNTVTHKLLHSELLVMREYVLQAKSTTVSAWRIRIKSRTNTSNDQIRRSHCLVCLSTHLEDGPCTSLEAQYLLKVRKWGVVYIYGRNRRGTGFTRFMIGTERSTNKSIKHFSQLHR